MGSIKNNSIITISDDSDMSIITISDISIVTISDISIMTISDDDDVVVVSSDNSIITISDTSLNDCDNVINVSDGSNDTSPSFDFETSAKLLLPQPRTSTPGLHGEAADAATKAKKRK